MTITWYEYHEYDREYIVCDECHDKLHDFLIGEDGMTYGGQYRERRNTFLTCNACGVTQVFYGLSLFDDDECDPPERKTYDLPPEHANCRCAVKPEMKTYDPKKVKVTVGGIEANPTDFYEYHGVSDLTDTVQKVDPDQCHNCKYFKFFRADPYCEAFERATEVRNVCGGHERMEE